MKKLLRKATLVSALVCGFCFASPQTMSAGSFNETLEQGHLQSVDGKITIGDRTYTFVTTREGDKIMYVTDADGNKVGEYAL